MIKLKHEASNNNAHSAKAGLDNVFIFEILSTHKLLKNGNLS